MISYKGIPENEDDTFIFFDMEDEILNICRTFSLDNKQQQNLIETIKNKIAEESKKRRKTGKTFTKY